MTTLSIEINEETRSALNTLADSRHQTIEALARMAIENLVQQEREFREDDEAWNDYVKNGGIESERIIAWLNDRAKEKQQP